MCSESLLLFLRFGIDWAHGFISSGCPKRIRNGQRKTADGFPAEEGRVDFDLGIARRAAYVGKLEGGISNTWRTLSGNTPDLASPTMARSAITMCVEFSRVL